MGETRTMPIMCRL